MNTADFEQILDSCLARFSQGETIEQCLADYPDAADKLRPILRVASVFQSAPRPLARPQAVKNGQAAMLAALNQQERDSAVSFATLQRYAERILSILKQEETSQMRLALRSVVPTILLIFITGFFALTISANSLPGEPFYPVKLGWESFRVGLTFDGDARQQLEAQIQRNRQQELTALIELGRQTRLVYEGFVEQIESAELIVDGFTFETNDRTRWLIDPEPGEAVQIKTEITAEGELIALEIDASPLDSRPFIAPIPTTTPCNTPTCAPSTASPTPCNTGLCGKPTQTPTASVTPVDPTSTPTPCNSPVCSSETATPTPCSLGACGTVTATPLPTSTHNSPTATPCNSPACTPLTATPTPCTIGCGNQTPTPPPTSPPPNPTSTPCNSPACAPPTPSPTPCNGGTCGNPTFTPFPTFTPPKSTPTPCNTPVCNPHTPSPTPCNTGTCGNPTMTPFPSFTPPGPTATPCNGGACGSPTLTPPPTPTSPNTP